MAEQVVESPKPHGTPWSGGDIAVALLTGTLLGGLLVVVLLSATAIDDVLSENSMVGFIGITIYASLMVSAWFFALHRRSASWAAAGFRPVGAGSLLTMVPAAIGLMILNAVVALLTRAVIGETPTASEQLLVDRFEITPGELVWLLLVGVVAAPVVEEFIFRGLIFRYLRNIRGKPAEVIASAAVFALLHFIASLLVVLFVIGIVLALVAEHYDSIYPSITLHALHNGLTIMILYGALRSA
jgi:membrane protease YdiL (CAAX protease family)